MLEDNDSSDNIAATDEEDMTRVLSEKKKTNLMKTRDVRIYNDANELHDMPNISPPFVTILISSD